jgi:uncharacterized protein YecT (DUF1311 family)
MGGVRHILRLRRSMTSLAIAIPLLAGAAGPAPASPAKHRHSVSPLGTCLAGKSTGLDMQQCIHDEMDRKWVRMERAYADLLHRLPPGKARALKRDQQAWIAGRESRCANEELEEDGLMCLVHQNERRTEELRHRLRSLPSRAVLSKPII